MYNKWISGGQVESHPNPQCQTFHMRHELVPQGRWYSNDSCASNEWKEGDPYLTRVLVKAIQKIPGVKSVSVHQYEISIIKADAFTFPELYPAIKLAMAKYLPAQYN